MLLQLLILDLNPVLLQLLILDSVTTNILLILIFKSVITIINNGS